MESVTVRCRHCSRERWLPARVYWLLVSRSQWRVDYCDDVCHREYIGHREEVVALVLGAAPSGSPGPLVANFCGNDAGKLPCPVMLIPGSLTDERLEQLS